MRCFLSVGSSAWVTNSSRIPWEALNISPGGDVFILNVPREKLDNAPDLTRIAGLTGPIHPGGDGPHLLMGISRTGGGSQRSVVSDSASF